MSKNNKVEDKSIKFKKKTDNKRAYHFPSLGKVVMASSLEEAQKKAKFNKASK